MLSICTELLNFMIKTSLTNAKTTEFNVSNPCDALCSVTLFWELFPTPSGH